MNAVKRSITLTAKADQHIESLVSTGEFRNRSQAISSIIEVVLKKASKKEGIK